MRAYPQARTEDATDTLSGVSFADPYHWLEENSDEVRRWERCQSELARAYVREWPCYHQLRELVAHFNTPRQVQLPRFAAGLWFRIDASSDASTPRVIVAREPMGDGRVVFDAMTEKRDPAVVVSWIAPSPDGRALALGICSDGSENNAIHLIDVATGEHLPHPPTQVLMDNWTGGAQWLPDSSGFFFSAILGAAVDFEQQVYLHRRVPEPRTDPIDVKWTQINDYRIVVVSRDGRHAVATERLLNPIPVALADLQQEPLRWRPFITSISGTVAGHLLGDRYIAVTDVSAPRGRLVAIPLSAEDPNDSGKWNELVPESNAVLRTVTATSNALYLTELVDTYTRLRIVDFDGKPCSTVPLPDRGAIIERPYPFMNLVPQGYPDRFMFAFSSLTTSPGVYFHIPAEEGVKTLQMPSVRLKGVVVEDIGAVSADGTRIPYHLVRSADVREESPRPTLIYAYGGYNDPFPPKFAGPLAAFVAAGGILVHAHLRGGGEFGLEWWQCGRMQRKQNCFDDLYAIAEHLIATRRCTARLLAVTGRSNGGLVAAVAVLQRPDLWAVAVPQVPLLDLVGACRDAYGRQGIMEELANVEEPDEVRRLVTFSPYHLIREGVRYPAVLVQSGRSDPRCPPWHARKFVARLQNASASDMPILMRIWDNVGHGGAWDKDTAIDEYTEWLAFVLRQLGVEDCAGASRNEGVSP